MNKYQPRCAVCNKFVSYDADSYIPYGCADPENPEPYDPSYLCSEHAEEEYKDYVRDFTNGKRSGEWTKSQAEMRAARECGLAWIGSNGVGILGDKNGNWKDAHQYIDQKEFDRLKALPYWGYCKSCGYARKGSGDHISCPALPPDNK